MANPVLEELRAEIARNDEVDASAVLLIKGIADRITAAVTAAIANGATAEELAPVTEQVAALRKSSDALAAAVAENTGA